MVRDLLFRLRSVLFRRAAERDLADEMAFHLEEQRSKHEHAGIEPGAAARLAHSQLGGIEQVKEACRDARGTRFVDETVRDVRYAIRMFAKHKASTATALIGLASGLGVTVAIVGMVDALLLRPPPGVRAPAELAKVSLVNRAENALGPSRIQFSVPQFDEFVAAQTAFARVAGFARFETQASTASDPERITQEVVTGDYFNVLGVAPAVGRTLQPTDDVAGGAAVVMISHAYWQRAFAGDPMVLGKSLRLKTNVVTVVGVTPAEFGGTSIEYMPNPEVWIPVRVWATINRSNRLTLRFPLLEAIGRLRAGDSVDLARARMAETMRHVTVLPSDPAQVNAIVVEPLHRTGPSTRERFGRLFGVLLVVSVVALIAACFNVANLLMSHGVGRARELAVRSAIGASATALVRQLLTEGLMLGAAAGLLATLVAGVFTRTFRDLGRIVHFQDVSITPAFDLRLLAAGVGLTVGMTLLFGVLPAILISRRGAATRLSFTAPLSQQRPFHPVIRQAVIAAQVALAVLLVSAALLYGQALQRMRDIPVGFRPDNILLMRLDPYQLTPPEGAQFYRTALATIAELPGVVAVGTSYWQPLSGVSGSLRVMTPERSEPLQTVSSLSVGFDFFKAYALPVSGRELTTDDDLASGILVNDLLAERFWPGQPATNRMLRTQGPTGGPTADRRVLGVVKMDRCNELAWDPAPCAFMPVRPYSNGGMRLSIRTEGAPVRVADQVRTALAAVDRRVLVDEVRPFTTFLDERMSREHTAVRLTVALAVLGVFLVAVGCVNLFAALIAERRSEIAVRMVLGARPLRLITDVLRRGMWLSLVGVAIAAGIGHLLYASIQEWLFEITEPSPRGLASAGIGILLITLLATSIPAYRQTRIQPTEALKEAGP